MEIVFCWKSVTVTSFSSSKNICYIKASEDDAGCMVPIKSVASQNMTVSTYKKHFFCFSKKRKQIFLCLCKQISCFPVFYPWMY